MDFSLAAMPDSIPFNFSGQEEPAARVLSLGAGVQSRDKIIDFKSGVVKLKVRGHSDNVYLQQVGNDLLLSIELGGAAFVILSNVSDLQQSDLVNGDVTLISDADLDPSETVSIALDIV